MNNNSKKTSSSSSGKKIPLPSHLKAPSANSKKKSAKSKVKEQTLRSYSWIYTGILFALLILPLILRNHLIVQFVSVSCVWAGLYYFCIVVDHIVVSSRK